MTNPTFKSKLLACASVGALAFAAAPALAQEADAEEAEYEEITVSGIRASIRNSVEKKRMNSSIVEAISAEDIGKLPDASIGEALARLPGLAAQRFDGRANKVAIRGLAPDFTSTTMNGREMVSSDNNRAVEYDQFPSELITGATVYKTPDASLTSQAVGGTVDMQTVRPLSYKEPVMVFGLRGEMASGGGKNPGVSNRGYRGNFAYIGQNEDGTVGYAFGYSRMVQPIAERHNHHWGYDDVEHNGQTVKILNGFKPYIKTNKLTRDGVLGVIELKPNDDWSSRFDAFYSKFKDRQTLRGMEVAGNTASSREILAVEDGLVTDFIYHDMRFMGRNDFTDRDVKTYAFGWNTEYQVNDMWSTELDVSYSKAEREYASSEIYLTDGRGQSGSSTDLRVSMLDGVAGATATGGALDYNDGSWQLGDNLGWGGPLCGADDGWAKCNSQDLYRNTETSEDDLLAVKLAAEAQLGGDIIDNVEFGVRWSKRQKDHTFDGQWAALNAYANDQDPNIVPIPAEHLLDDPTDLSFAGLGNLVSFDPRAVWASGLYTTPTTHQFDLAKILARNWNVEEKVFNAYVMANIDTETVTGNVGLQYVRTDQSSNGIVVNNADASVSNVLDGTEFSEWLPSLNLSYNMDEDNKLRFGAARILARPKMDQMNASRGYGFDIAKYNATSLESSPWNGEGGNPYLKPWMAWQFDLSYETYFGEGGYASIAGFYKKLENYVFTQKVLVDFSNVPVPDGFEPALSQGFIDAPENGEGGKIYGIEFSTSIPFENFSEELAGFGFLGSASITKSSVKETATSVATELPGLSKSVINGTLYYENEAGFQARVSVRHRSSYLAETFALSQNREERRTVPETILDAQLSYDLDEMGYEGFTMYLQGSNLTNEPFVTYENGDPRQYRNYHTYGRSVMFGFTYKM